MAHCNFKSSCRRRYQSGEKDATKGLSWYLPTSAEQAAWPPHTGQWPPCDWIVRREIFSNQPWKVEGKKDEGGCCENNCQVLFSLLLNFKSPSFMPLSCGKGRAETNNNIRQADQNPLQNRADLPLFCMRASPTVLVLLKDGLQSSFPPQLWTPSSWSQHHLHLQLIVICLNLCLAFSLFFRFWRLKKILQFNTANTAKGTNPRKER